MLQSMGSQRVGLDWAAEKQWYNPKHLQAFSGTQWNPTRAGSYQHPAVPPTPLAPSGKLAPL